MIVKIMLILIFFGSGICVSGVKKYRTCSGFRMCVSVFFCIFTSGGSKNKGKCCPFLKNDVFFSVYNLRIVIYGIVYPGIMRELNMLRIFSSYIQYVVVTL